MKLSVDSEIIAWLLEGDPSIQYQVHRDLLGEERADLRDRIQSDGWGKFYLSQRLPNGHWGNKFYHPKWISTHYTLLDLKNLGISPTVPEIGEAVDLILEKERGIDGGINPAGSTRFSDACVNGMFLNFACYFKASERRLEPVVDFILSQRMSDGGYNCMLNRQGATHSSLHSTISMCEGIHEYHRQGYKYRLDELLESERDSREFILLHQLYISDRTGEVINDKFLRFPFSPRWYYDIMRALDYFQDARVPYDHRMVKALNHIASKRTKNGKWKVGAKHPGEIHMDLEKAGKESRYNTLRALRILGFYNKIPS